MEAHAAGDSEDSESPVVSMPLHQGDVRDMISKYFDEIKVGEKNVTAGRTITEGDIVNFAMFTGDWHPLHTDAEYAKSGPFGERIAHGLLVLSVASGLTPLAAGPVLAFYGMDRLRFMRATKIGDTIHVETEVIAKEERNESSGLVTSKQVIKNQHGEDLAVSTWKMLVAKQNSGHREV